MRESMNKWRNRSGMRKKKGRGGRKGEERKGKKRMKERRIGKWRYRSQKRENGKVERRKRKE